MSAHKTNAFFSHLCAFFYYPLLGGVLFSLCDMPHTQAPKPLTHSCHYAACLTNHRMMMKKCVRCVGMCVFILHLQKERVGGNGLASLLITHFMLHSVSSLLITHLLSLLSSTGGCSREMLLRCMFIL